MKSTKVKYFHDGVVKVCTEDNNTVLNMSTDTFDALQKIINGDFEVVEELDTTDKIAFNVIKDGGNFEFKSLDNTLSRKVLL